jgi:NAD+ kinase
MPHPFKSIALVGNAKDLRVAECMLSLAGPPSMPRDCTLVDRHRLASRRTAWSAAPSSLRHRADLIIAIGGDGTLLYAAGLVAGHPVPLLGINRGGWASSPTSARIPCWRTSIPCSPGRYTEDRRSLLAARLERGGAAGARAGLERRRGQQVGDRPHHGLRDLHQRPLRQFPRRRRHGDRHRHRLDRLCPVLRRPIVEPDLDVWVLAPISPHTLSDRPIVVRAGSKIQLRMSDRVESRAQVTCDGTAIGESGTGRQSVRRGRRCQITLLHPPGYDYYRLLRSKLHWGRGGYGS